MMNLIKRTRGVRTVDFTQLPGATRAASWTVLLPPAAIAPGLRLVRMDLLFVYLVRTRPLFSVNTGQLVVLDLRLLQQVTVPTLDILTLQLVCHTHRANPLWLAKRQLAPCA